MTCDYRLEGVRRTPEACHRIDLSSGLKHVSPLTGPSVSGTISIAADDFAEVFVNGVSAGTIGSVSDISLASLAQSVLTTFDLSPYLVAGDNTITIMAQNGPAEYAGCPGVCPYAENPAGVVFAGSLSAAVPD